MKKYWMDVRTYKALLCKMKVVYILWSLSVVIEMLGICLNGSVFVIALYKWLKALIRFKYLLEIHMIYKVSIKCLANTVKEQHIEMMLISTFLTKWVPIGSWVYECF